MARRNRIPRLIKNLLLALLNATLMLALLCLIFAYLTMRKVDGVVATFAENLIEVQPLRDELAAMNENLSGLRSDLATMRDASGEVSDAALLAIQARVGRIEAEVAATRTQIHAILDAPEVLIDQAIISSGEVLKDIVLSAVNCQRPPEPPALTPVPAPEAASEPATPPAATPAPAAESAPASTTAPEPEPAPAPEADAVPEQATEPEPAQEPANN